MTNLDREELLDNLEGSLRLVSQIEQIDNRVAKIYRKPIRISWNIHMSVMLTIFSSLGILVLFHEFTNWTIDFPYEIPYIDSFEVFKFIGIPVLVYPALIVFINLYTTFSKRWLFRGELEKLRIKRLALVEKLNGFTAIPAEFWSVLNLTRMQKYIRQHRADDLKEALNLLAEDIRHDQLMLQLGVPLPKVKG